MDSEILTSEQARTIELPSFLHPIERIREIGRLANTISSTKNVGWFPGDQTVFTRSGLVMRAEAHETATRWMEQLKHTNEGDI
jgi:hypothetical protein